MKTRRPIVVAPWNSIRRSSANDAFAGTNPRFRSIERKRPLFPRQRRKTAVRTPLRPAPGMLNYVLVDFFGPHVRDIEMTKPHHKLKKANHGARPANAKARRAKRRVVKT